MYFLFLEKTEIFLFEVPTWSMIIKPDIELRALFFHTNKQSTEKKKHFALSLFENNVISFNALSGVV